MENPSISVIIPVYNVEAYLCECLDSVIAQTEAGFEIICVNDGSTDGSRAILEGYSKRESRLIVIDQENSGQSKARNAGLDAARGEYIYFLDADDRIRADALRLCLEVSARERLDVLFFDGSTIFESEGLRESKHYMERYLVKNGRYDGVMDGPELLCRMVRNDEFKAHVCVQFARRAFLVENNIRFVEGMVFEDADYTLRRMLLAKRAMHMPEELFVRRIREDSSVTSEETGTGAYRLYSRFRSLKQIKAVFGSHGFTEELLACARQILQKRQTMLVNEYNAASEEQKQALEGMLGAPESLEFTVLAGSIAAEQRKGNELAWRLGETGTGPQGMDMPYSGVAVAITDFVEFFSIRNGIDALLAEGVSVDIFVPSGEGQQQAWRREASGEVSDFIKAQGYSPISEASTQKRYKVLLEPYPMEKYFHPGRIEHEFRIKYKYSLMTAKPNPVFSPPWNIVYDAILCHTKREAEILSAYTKTFVVAPMKYKGFQKDAARPDPRPALLYLPTFGDASSIDSIESALSNLKDDYYIVVKAHHKTHYQEEERKRIDILKSVSDEYYGQTANVVRLLEKADIVLSDNSAAIFEALYAEIPVGIYNGSTLNTKRIGDVDTYQYQLVKRGVVPYTSDASEVGTVLRMAMGKRAEQRLEKDDFPDAEDLTQGFVDTVKLFLEEDRSKSEYYAMHDVLRDSFAALRQDDGRRQSEMEEAERRIKSLEDEISGMLGSRTWKTGKAVAAPYRLLTGRGKGKGQ